MFLVPFKNGWTDSAKLFFAGSVGVRRKFFGRKKPNSASGFVGITGKLRFLEYYLTNWAKIFRQGACGPTEKIFFQFFFRQNRQNRKKTGRNRKNLTLHNIDMWYIIFHVETMGRSILTLVLENWEIFFKLADFLHKILNFWLFPDF